MVQHEGQNESNDTDHPFGAGQDGGSAELHRRVKNQGGSSHAHEEDEQGESMLVFGEFLEALCAVAAFRSPDPFVAIDRKISALLQSLFDDDDTGAA